MWVQKPAKQVSRVQTMPSSQSVSWQHSPQAPPQHVSLAEHFGDVTQVRSGPHSSTVHGSPSSQSSGPEHAVPPPEPADPEEPPELESAPESAPELPAAAPDPSLPPNSPPPHASTVARARSETRRSPKQRRMGPIFTEAHGRAIMW